MFPDAYSASFFYDKTLLYQIPDAGTLSLPPPTPGATTLVLCKTEQGQLSEPELLFLNNILKAVGLPAEVVQIIPVLPASGKLNIGGLLRVYQPKKIITFGFRPEEIQMNLSLKLYLPFELGGSQILLADALNTLENDKSKKLALWQHLKRMFGV